MALEYEIFPTLKRKGEWLPFAPSFMERFKAFRNGLMLTYTGGVQFLQEATAFLNAESAEYTITYSNFDYGNQIDPQGFIFLLRLLAIG